MNIMKIIMENKQDILIKMSLIQEFIFIFFNQKTSNIFSLCIIFAKLNDKFAIIQKETKSAIQLIGNIFDIKIKNNFIYIVGTNNLYIFQNIEIILLIYL